MPKTLYLLDAFALVFRAYYALIRSPRMTTKGRNTNAQFGFTNALLDILQQQRPTHMAVCFDTHALTERHTDFADYKANRQETPEDILAAVPDIKRIIRGFQIPVIEKDGYEADDIIGTLARQAEREGYEVFMVTPDKDYGQLVTDRIKIYKPPYQGGVHEILGPTEVCAKWDIREVSQVVDMLGMMGDAVDNIPGIPGVGEKTAAKLLKEYGSLDQILAVADTLKGAMGEKVRQGRDMALLSRKLATIITDVPVSFHEEDFRVKDWDRIQLTEVFTELEFKTLGKRILGQEITTPRDNPPASVVQTDLFGSPLPTSVPPAADPEPEIVVCEKNIGNTPHQYHTIRTDEEREGLLSRLRASGRICFDTETTSVDAHLAELVGMSFAVEPGVAYYVPLDSDRNQALQTLSCFDTLFADRTKTWIGHNIKYDLLVLRWYGKELAGPVFDTLLAHYVIEPEGKRSMDVLSAKYLGYEPIPIEALIGKKGKNQGNMRDVDLPVIAEYAAEDADITLQLQQAFLPRLSEQGVEKVFQQVENPLVKVLADMEFEGIRIDVDFLKQYSQQLEQEAAQTEQRVYDLAGVRFNLASPRQLGEVLFEVLKLDPKAKKTKTGQYATGEDILQKLAPQHPICADILIYRELTKLKSTYVDALPELIHPVTGRVHTSYAQAVAVTGRLSSNNPNLQNIPIRTERGREIRKAFIPRDANHVLVSADYSQIELRIVAAISGDENMCRAFREGKDIHTATAALVFHVPEAEVTREMRYKAKSVNFGIIYGQGAFGLAENLSISRTEARDIIDNYKSQFPGITRYMNDTVAFAKEQGYVQTLMGRKRWLRDIQSANFTVRSFAERNAINSPIQGTAADMIKLAMIAIHERLRREGFRSRMLLQVHDELVFDVPKDELDRLRPVVLEEMTRALALPHDVPVEAEWGFGASWLDAH